MIYTFLIKHSYNTDAYYITFTLKPNTFVFFFSDSKFYDRHFSRMRNNTANLLFGWNLSTYVYPVISIINCFVGVLLDV